MQTNGSTSVPKRNLKHGNVRRRSINSCIAALMYHIRVPQLLQSYHSGDGETQSNTGFTGQQWAVGERTCLMEWLSRCLPMKTISLWGLVWMSIPSSGLGASWNVSCTPWKLNVRLWPCTHNVPFDLKISFPLSCRKYWDSRINISNRSSENAQFTTFGSSKTPACRGHTPVDYKASSFVSEPDKKLNFTLYYLMQTHTSGGQRDASHAQQQYSTHNGGATVLASICLENFRCGIMLHSYAFELGVSLAPLYHRPCTTQKTLKAHAQRRSSGADKATTL